MAEGQNNADRMKRFITGEISRCCVGNKKDQFDQYSLYIEGAYEDTREPFSGYVSTKSPNFKAYKEGEVEAMDKSELDGKKFKGRIQVSEVVYNDRPDHTFRFLNAILVSSTPEDDPYEPAGDEGNPFLDNPLT